MNILVVANGIPKKSGEINGIFAFDQAKALSNEGVNVFFAVIDTRSIRHIRKFGFYKYVKDGIPVYECSIPVGRVPTDVLLKMIILGLKIIYREISHDGIKIDIVHTHFYEMTYAASYLKEKYQYKLVATEHYSAFVNPENKNRASLIKRASIAYQNVDCLIAVSGALANVIRNECHKNVVVIHNILDVSSFGKCSPSHNHEYIRFISVGRLTPQKNYPLLIESFRKAHDVNKNIRLDIYGDGELRKTLQNLIHENDADEYIVLHGATQRGKIGQEMQKAECFILLSNFETFGVVYIEAMAAGLPVIATKCGGPSDFVNCENGIIIECGNKNEAVNAILNMAENYMGYDSKKISASSRSEFSPQTIANSIITQYLRVMKQ